MPAPTADAAAVAGDRDADTDAPGYLVAGDALRAFAALCVLTFHAEQTVAFGLGDAVRADPSQLNALAPWLAQGSAGVWVFFALSGYLVGGPFVRAWVYGTPTPRAGRYLARRLRRIVPAFWVVLAVVLVRFGTYDHDALEILRLFAFAQNIGTADIDGVLPQGWTLGSELGFYLALPVLAALVARGAARATGTTVTRRRTVVLAGLAVVAAASLAVRAQDDTGPLTLTTVATAWAFVPGLLLATLEDVLRPRLRGTLTGRVLALVLLAVSVGTIAGLALAEPGTQPLTAELLRALAGATLVVAAVVWQWTTGGVPRAATVPAAHALGRWSYGIYLVHIAVGREVSRRMPDGLGGDAKLAVTLGGMMVLSVIAAALLWWLVEEPALTGRRPSWSPARGAAPPRAPSAG